MLELVAEGYKSHLAIKNEGKSERENAKTPCEAHVMG
jgi:hypothetical protein